MAQLLRRSPSRPNSSEPLIVVRTEKSRFAITSSMLSLILANRTSTVFCSIQYTTRIMMAPPIVSTVM
jgi:hypothetical protein